MNNSEQELYDEVNFALSDLAWGSSYPLHQGVGIWSFINALEEGGAGVDIGREGITAEMKLDIGLGKKPYNTTMDYESILMGWRNSPFGSVRSLQDSIYTLFDQMVKDDYDLGDKYDEVRSIKCRNITSILHGKLDEYITKYQEHVFVPITGESREFKKPELFFEVLGEFPMPVFERSRELELNPDINRELDFDPYDGYNTIRVTPAVHALLEMEWSDFVDFEDSQRNGGRDVYHPTTSVMIEYFMGLYLQKLAIQKGYTGENGSNELERFMVNGFRNFRPHEKVDWPEKIRNRRVGV